MTLRRLSIRKIFLYLVAIGGLILIVLNVRSKEWDNANLLQIQHGGDEKILTTENGGQHSIYVTENSVYGSESAPVASIVIKNVEKSKEIASSAVNDKDVYKNRPWFMYKGGRWPKPVTRSKKTSKRLAKLFPEEDPNNDRIINQLMYMPPEYDPKTFRKKKIYLHHGTSGFLQGQKKDLFGECPVSTCEITTSRDDFYRADAVLFKDGSVPNRGPATPMKQIWIMYLLECPHHTGGMPINGQINWTATYRHDSDIVTPYERWVYHDERVHYMQNQQHNYAANKTKQVAWFVSNCFARNARLQYGKELQKHISVDIYGSCGNHVCPRGRAKECFKLLERNYKFYLAFENSNCKDYITEKFFVNGLGHGTIPIVMGARPEDYARAAPHHSYIHVDEFISPKELAAYLHRLDKDEKLYNMYFRWQGTGEFINTYFWCRLCAMLHDDANVYKNYENLNEWWRGEGICEKSPR